MKIFTKLVSVFLLVAIGSLFFFSCAEKEKCTPMVSDGNFYLSRKKSSVEMKYI